MSYHARWFQGHCLQWKKKAKVAEQRQAVATKVSKGMESYPKDKVGRLLLA
jgi:hypothetical protein